MLTNVEKVTAPFLYACGRGHGGRLEGYRHIREGLECLHSFGREGTGLAPNPGSVSSFQTLGKLSNFSVPNLFCLVKWAYEHLL